MYFFFKWNFCLFIAFNFAYFYFKFKYDEKITSKTNGKFKKGCIFSTYSALIGETTVKAKFKSRLDQLLHWCGDDFDGVIILDECHKAKNLMPVGSSKPTKTGITVLRLQDRLPKARVVYCSATGIIFSFLTLSFSTIIIIFLLSHNAQDKWAVICILKNYPKNYRCCMKNLLRLYNIPKFFSC